MQLSTSPIESQKFDGPFKVPMPKKSGSETATSAGQRSQIKVPKPKYKKIDSRYQSVVYQKLLVKLLQKPDSLWAYEMKILSTHPIIKRLLKTSKGKEGKNNSFYIPIDSFLNPTSYANSHVPVIMESEPEAPQNESKAVNETNSIGHEELANDSTDSSHNSEANDEEMPEEKVGFYTKKERQERILKYKQKLQRYREGKAANQLKAKKRKTHSRCQPRKNGRFASYPDVTEDILMMIKGESDQKPTSPDEVLNTQPGTGNGETDLNILVSQITGIF